MSITQNQAQDRKYLVYAIYRTHQLMNSLTRIIPVKIVSACSSFSAIAIASRYYNPDGERPTSYVAACILGPYRVNMFSQRTYTCEELLSIGVG